MRSVIVSNLVSLDGYMCGPGGDIGWFTSVWDKDLESYSVGLIDEVDTMLFGRVTYDMMAAYWPNADPGQDDPRIIRAMNETPKVVFSRTLRSPGWRNTRVAAIDAAAEVRRLKGLPGKSMVIYGSGAVVRSLSSEGLIDDYRILVAPVVLGAGTRLFETQERRLDLKLVETRTYRTGTALLRYRYGGEMS